MTEADHKMLTTGLVRLVGKCSNLEKPVQLHLICAVRAHSSGVIQHWPFELLMLFMTSSKLS